MTQPSPQLDPGTGLCEAMVTARGRRFRTVRAGKGRPTVVFESGLSMSASAWVAVQRTVSEVTGTLAYDRAGYGGSDAVRDARRVDDLVEDLEEVLTASGIDGPLLLVGHSRGGVVMRRFVQTTARPLTGLLLVDPSISNLTNPRQERISAGLLRAVASLSRFGLQRPLLRLTMKDATITLADEDMRLVKRDALTSFAAAAGESRGAVSWNLSELESQGFPAGLSVTFLMGQLAENRALTKARARFLDATDAHAAQVGAQVLRASKSCHFVQGSEPSLVAETILDMVGGHPRLA